MQTATFKLVLSLAELKTTEAVARTRLGKRNKRNVFRFRNVCPQPKARFNEYNRANLRPNLQTVTIRRRTSYSQKLSDEARLIQDQAFECLTDAK